jgi:HlyD family secretion protein
LGGVNGAGAAGDPIGSRLSVGTTSGQQAGARYQVQVQRRGLLQAEQALGNARDKLARLIGLVAAQVLRARESLHEARDRLSETKIHSPISGTVLERAVQPGQIVASGTTTVNGGTTLLKIADLGRFFVRVKVDEADVTKIVAGQKVRITADALPGKVLARKVLRPAMTANVEVLVAERKATVLVPARALRRKEANGQAETFVVVRGAGTRAVEVGLSDGKDTEIRAGLEGGEEILLSSSQAREGKPQGGAGMNANQMRRMVGGGR